MMKVLVVYSVVHIVCQAASFNASCICCAEVDMRGGLHNNTVGRKVLFQKFSCVSYFFVVLRFAVTSCYVLNTTFCMQHDHGGIGTDYCSYRLLFPPGHFPVAQLY